MSYFHWIYRSTETVALSEMALTDLLIVARQRNVENQLTGILLHADGQFLQVLEGPRSNVEKFREIISNDDRHHKLITLKYENKTALDFPDWSMAFATPNCDDLRGYSQFLSDSAATESIMPTNSAEMNRILHGFRS